MNDSELRQALTAMNSAANKRLKRLQESGLTPYSAAASSRGGDRFTSPGRGAGRNELLGAIAEVRQFMQAPSSTSRAARATKTVITEADPSIDWTVDEMMDYIYQYDAIRTEREDLGSQRVRAICQMSASPREAVQEIIRQWEAMKVAVERHTSIYEESIRRARDASGGRNAYDAWVELEDFEGMPF